MRASAISEQSGWWPTVTTVSPAPSAAERPDLVVSSPLLRARETAAAIAKAAGAEVRVDERLAPGAAADDLVAAVEGAGETVVAVGHQPDCSEIALALTGTDPGFPTAGSYELDVS